MFDSHIHEPQINFWSGSRYSRDGIATSKSDVYAFGVVLFELITGKEAISKSRVSIPSTPERRSLISIVRKNLVNVDK